MFRKRCSTCGAALVLVPTASGKEMPCEDRQLGREQISEYLRYAVVRGSEGCVVISADVIAEIDAFDSGDVRIFEPHWGNCNAPDQHRRRKR